MTPLHWSMLKNIDRSPAHYRHATTHPIKETPSMLLGTAVHCMVLGGPRTLAVYEGERRGNAWKDFAAAHVGDTIITEKEQSLARAIADAVLADELAASVLVGQLHELAIEWTVNGRACAGRVDSVSVDGASLCDLKTTQDASPRRFQWQARQMGYLGQLAWYSDGLEAAGYPASQFQRIVAVETRAPYPVVVYQLTPEALDFGRRQWRLMFDRLRVCEQADEWPGYVQCMVPLDAPADDVELDFAVTEESP